MFSVRSVLGLYNKDYAVVRSEKLVAEARNGLGNPEKGEHLPLEATTRQRLVKTEKTFCVLLLK
jgi:hypothetical protein